MTHAKSFWDKAAPKYAQSPIRDEAAYEYTLGRTRSYLKATDKMLELGSGTGSTALLLAPQVAEVTATDISPEMMRIASQKAAAKGIGSVRFEVATALEAARKAQDYDVVAGFNIFHLTDDFEGILKELAERMAPGTLFISKTPCLGDRSLGLKRFAFRALIPLMRMVRMAPNVRFFTMAALDQLIEEAGFDLVETGNFPAMSRYIVARRRG